MKDKKIFKEVNKYVVSITRAEGGHVHEAVDKLHRVTLPKQQTEFIKKLKKKLYVEKGSRLFLGDTPAKMSQKLRQVSGGFIKDEEEKVYSFKENPKVEYIKRNFNPKTTIILAYFKAEQEYIKSIFPHTGSTTRNSEGVDYSHFKDMVIYSHPFASSTYIQVRARQMNINRKDPITVHFLIAGDIDQHVYDVATGKEKFTRRWYE